MSISNPFSSIEYQSELDALPYVGTDLITIYQNLMGMLWWLREFEYIEVIHEVILLSQYKVQPYTFLKIGWLSIHIQDDNYKFICNIMINVSWKQIPNTKTVDPQAVKVKYISSEELDDVEVIAASRNMGNWAIMTLCQFCIRMNENNVELRICKLNSISTNN